MGKTAVILYEQGYGLVILYTCSNFLDRIPFSLVSELQNMLQGGISHAEQTSFWVSCCIPFLDLPSLLAHRIVYSLANLLNPLMDQAQNDLHITIVSAKLVRRLTNHIVLKFAGHSALIHKQDSISLLTNNCFCGLSREGQSGEGTQSSCVPLQSLSAVCEFNSTLRHRHESKIRHRDNPYSSLSSLKSSLWSAQFR